MTKSFKDGGFHFINSLANKNGHDLIYSLALEKGNIFVCIAAHPSMTKKRWSTGNERITFLIDKEEYNMDQDELIADLTRRITDHIVYVDEWLKVGKKLKDAEDVEITSAPLDAEKNEA